jgi:hypothetical protein
MSYYSTPRQPLSSIVSRYTPSSSAIKKVGRAPILNPYDKFTRPEFDEFIDDITGALRQALGYEASPRVEPVQITESDRVSARDDSSLVGDGHEDVEDEEPVSDVDDDEEYRSDQIATRSALAKGKGRDPREGPGLIGHSFSQPIDLLSDSDGEGGEERLSEGREVNGERDDIGLGEEGWDDAEDDDDGGEYTDEERDWRNGKLPQTSIQRDTRYEEEYDEKDYEEEDEGGGEDGEREASPEIIEIQDSDAEEDSKSTPHKPSGTPSKQEDYPEEDADAESWDEDQAQQSTPPPFHQNEEDELDEDDGSSSPLPLVDGQLFATLPQYRKDSQTPLEDDEDDFVHESEVEKGGELEVEDKQPIENNTGGTKLAVYLQNVN